MTFNNINSKKITRGILIYIAVTFLFGVPAALISGIWPKTATGWLLIIMLAVPVMIVGGFIGEKLFSDKISVTLDPNRKSKQISPRRMVFSLLIGVIYIVLLLLVMHVFGDKIKTHFYFP